MPLDNPAGSSWSGRDRDTNRSQTKKENQFKDVQGKKKSYIIILKFKKKHAKTS